MLFLSACSTVPPTTKPETTPTTPTEPVEPVPHTVTLAYSRSDSLDPFKMTSRVNRELGALLYEGLTALDGAMQPQNALAEWVKVSGQTVTARLRADAVFSDGSAVTAADVVASFTAAKESAAYAPLLREFKEATAAEDARTVTFTLTKPDPFAAACLTFPVVRATDGTVLGSGRYVYDPAPRLLANPHWGEVTVPEIRLLDLVNDDERAGGVDVGSVTCFFSDLSAGSIPRVSGGLTSVPLNYLVYLGVNSGRQALTPSVRIALSRAIDRTRGADSVFAGYADATATPFHPLFLQGQGVDASVDEGNKTAAMSLLVSAGFAVPDKELMPPKGNTKTLSLNLLVCEDNGFKTALATYVKDQLATVGISVTLVPLPYDDYLVALRRGRYDLYIGEVRLAENMDLSPLLTKNGAAVFGVDVKGEAAKSYEAFLAGEQTLSEFLFAFSADSPFIPLYWRRGLAAYNRALTNVHPTAFDVYAGLENWKLTN